MAVYKLKDETDGQFIVRALKEAYDNAIGNENAARLRKEAAFNALSIAEQALKVAQNEAARASSDKHISGY